MKLAERDAADDLLAPVHLRDTRVPMFIQHFLQRPAAVG
jgi:hypothetical protein